MSFKFVRAAAADMNTMTEWHKSPSVRKWIYIDDWFAYYSAVRDDPDYYLYSVYSDGMLTAHIAAEKINGELAVDLIVNPQLQGKGYGTAVIKDMIIKTTGLFGNIRSYTACIYPDNIPGRKCFEKAGFVFCKEGSGSELVYKYEFITDVIAHYDSLVGENNDPVHDPAPLRGYMDKWDGRVFSDELRLSPDKSVLEIGVGTGRLAVKTAPLCGSFTGIDISPKTVKRAKENLAQFRNVSLICGDFLAYRFDCLFDVIYSSLTFMHIGDKPAAIRKAADLLNSGGRFVLSVDKSRKEYIDFGNRRVKIYPDDPVNIQCYIRAAGLLTEKRIETEFAHIFAAEKV